ncbi:hypothetical protein BCON_0132g00090 [Botryotinia convoluta]|uniref:Uncharacterized protein n=1 Tax=Botryotinia convoluta TaxID=54673 RepID=A0A4Z1I0H4_9HELO|nr:hypothetical protein BCON_0132g00090 [Botryotinia convoluta]
MDAPPPPDDAFASCCTSLRRSDPPNILTDFFSPEIRWNRGHRSCADILCDLESRGNELNGQYTSPGTGRRTSDGMS